MIQAVPTPHKIDAIVAKHAAANCDGCWFETQIPTEIEKHKIAMNQPICSWFWDILNDLNVLKMNPR